MAAQPDTNIDVVIVSHHDGTSAATTDCDEAIAQALEEEEDLAAAASTASSSAAGSAPQQAVAAAAATVSHFAEADLGQLVPSAPPMTPGASSGVPAGLDAASHGAASLSPRDSRLPELSLQQRGEAHPALLPLFVFLSSAICPSSFLLPSCLHHGSCQAASNASPYCTCTPHMCLSHTAHIHFIHWHCSGALPAATADRLTNLPSLLADSPLVRTWSDNLLSSLTLTKVRRRGLHPAPDPIQPAPPPAAAAMHSFWCRQRAVLALTSRCLTLRGLRPQRI